MKKEQIVSRNPKVMNGVLVFDGTRVPVEILIQHLTAGDSLNKFLEDFPTVSHEQVVAYLKMTLYHINLICSVRSPCLTTVCYIKKLLIPLIWY